MDWRRDKLPEIAARLASRPGHEQVREAVCEILRSHFHAQLSDIDHEIRMPEVRGRADTIFGATVFEWKANLRREMGDVLEKLPTTSPPAKPAPAGATSASPPTVPASRPSNAATAR